jgi:hypothetical protein
MSVLARFRAFLDRRRQEQLEETAENETPEARAAAEEAYEERWLDKTGRIDYRGRPPADPDEWP